MAEPVPFPQQSPSLHSDGSSENHLRRHTRDPNKQTSARRPHHSTPPTPSPSPPTATTVGGTVSNSTAAIPTPVSSNGKLSELRIYKYQVGGHYPIFYHDGMLYKPAFENEVRFYKELDEKCPELKACVPSFHGIHSLEKSSQNPNVSVATSKSNIQFSEWGELCWEKQGTNTFSRTGNRFIKLEDISRSFKRPCILDLKLGVRQHRTNAKPDKIQRQMKKCYQTTSRDVGLRLCGMQVYKPNEKKFQFHDKYTGRDADITRFTEILREYFDNGIDPLLREVAFKFVSKLVELEQIMKRLNSYRFWSASILLVYEGYRAPPASSVEPPSTSSSAGPVLDEDELANQMDPIDEKSSIPRRVVHPVSSEDIERENGELVSSYRRSSLSVPSADENDSDSDHTDICSQYREEVSRNWEKLDGPFDPLHIDVRLIDFSNTTHTVYDATVNAEPDEGLLFGVESLRRFIEQIAECGHIVVDDWDIWRHDSNYASNAREIFDTFDVDWSRKTTPTPITSPNMKRTSASDVIEEGLEIERHVDGEEKRFGDVGLIGKRRGARTSVIVEDEMSVRRRATSLESSTTVSSEVMSPARHEDL